jgi:hypothetical protein
VFQLATLLAGPTLHGGAASTVAAENYARTSVQLLSAGPGILAPVRLLLAFLRPLAQAVFLLLVAPR